MTQQTCHYCAEPAAFLCDRPLPAALAMKDGEPSCSRPLCKAHRVVRGTGIATFSRPKGGRRCERFTIALPV